MYYSATYTVTIRHWILHNICNHEKNSQTLIIYMQDKTISTTWRSTRQYQKPEDPNGNNYVMVNQESGSTDLLAWERIRLKAFEREHVHVSNGSWQLTVFSLRQHCVRHEACSDACQRQKYKWYCWVYHIRLIHTYRYLKELSLQLIMLKQPWDNTCTTYHKKNNRCYDSTHSGIEQTCSHTYSPAPHKLTIQYWALVSATRWVSER